jgi:V/A-type H+-transporting ATPase subunit C
MPDVAQYAYLNTRVSILAEQLLNHEQRQQLMEPEATQMDDLLQLSGVTLGEQANSLDSSSLEQLLLDILVRETGILTRSMDTPGKAFIRHWIRRFELVNLKLLLRSKFTQLPAKDLRSRLIDLGPLNGVPIDKLLATEDVAEFLRQLESTHYKSMAIQARQVYQEKQSLFDVESVLDSHYYQVLHRLGNALAGEHKRATRQLLGVLLDQVNLSWMLRLRFSYKLGSPHVYFLLAPGGHNLGMPVLLKLAQLENLEQVLQNIPEPLATRLSGATSIGSVESSMTELTRHTARHLLRTTNFNLGRAFAYLYLREQQLQLIHTALKGRLLSLDHDLVSSCGIREQEVA